MNSTAVSTAFSQAARINRSFTASMEKRALHWMAVRTPCWITSDHLTALGFAAQIAAGICYALARHHRGALLLVIVCLFLNWIGDSLDGTLARVRQQQRPRYGFYVDHVVDIFGASALMVGLGFSGLLHWPIAASLLIAFLLLSAESYLTTYTLSRFQLSQGLFGPTEIRIFLAAGNLALLRSPFAVLWGHRLLLFDLGGAIGTIVMLAMVAVTAARHTAELYREEPLA
jgi:archaetidylinositol phosphate synthase